MNGMDKMPVWIIKDIYKAVLVSEWSISDLAIFPGSVDTDPFLIYMGDWWNSEYLDPRYIKVQEYINSFI